MRDESVSKASVLKACSQAIIPFTHQDSKKDFGSELGIFLSCLRRVCFFNINLGFFSKGMNIKISKWEQAQNKTLL